MARQDAGLIGLSMAQAYGLGSYANQPEPPDNDFGIPNMTDADIETQIITVKVADTRYQAGQESVLRIYYAMPDGTTQTEEAIGAQNVAFYIVQMAQLTSANDHARLKGLIQADFIKLDDGWQHLSTYRV